MPQVLGSFARANPKVRIEARIARNAELIDWVLKGQLDLSLAWDGGLSTPFHQALGQRQLLDRLARLRAGALARRG